MEINFKRVHTAKDLITSTILLVAGIGLFFVSKGLGICIAVFSLLMFLIYKGGYKKNGRGVVLIKRSEGLCKACKPSIVDFLEGKEVCPVIKKGREGGIVLLEVYYNRENGIAYAQLFEFSNYTYEPVTEIVELKGNKAEELIASIR